MCSVTVAAVIRKLFMDCSVPSAKLIYADTTVFDSDSVLCLCPEFTFGFFFLHGLIISKFCDGLAFQSTCSYKLPTIGYTQFGTLDDEKHASHYDKSLPRSHINFLCRRIVREGL